MNYKNKLKNPQWQKKRLLIMERDDFSCQCCGSRSKTLNVHHLYYLDGLEPWEYDDNVLITLCEDCHQKEDERMPMQLLKLNYAITQSCVPSWIVRLLVSAFIHFLNKPKEATRFIVDLNKQSVRENEIIDKDKLFEAISVMQD